MPVEFLKHPVSMDEVFDYIDQFRQVNPFKAGDRPTWRKVLFDIWFEKTYPDHPFHDYVLWSLINA
jgi:hypothetical protein